MPWSLPWPSSQMVSRVAAAASRSSRSSRMAWWASAASGQATSRMWRPRCLSALASCSAARSSRCCSAWTRSLGSRSSGRSAQGPEDGLGLIDMDGAGGERLAGEVVVLEALGEPHRPVCLGPGGPGGVGVPVRGRGGTGGRGHLGPVGVGQEPGLELGQLGLRGLDLVEGGGGLAGVHRPHRQPRPPSPGLIAGTASARVTPGVAGSRSLSWVNSSSGHRHSRGPGIPVWITGSGTSAVDRKWTVPARIPPGRVPAEAAVVSTSSTSGDRLPARAGRFRDGRCATSSTSPGEGRTRPVAAPN